MMFDDKKYISRKLAKQLKALERKAVCVMFGELLDQVADRTTKPKQKRNHR